MQGRVAVGVTWLFFGLAPFAPGCASGDVEEASAGGPSTESGSSSDTDGGTSSSSETGAQASSAGDGTTPCEGGCDAAPGDCYEAAGECDMGVCSYPPKLAGEPCTDDCPDGGFCDASGQCICAEGGCEETCTAGEHATAMCDADGRCVRACEAPWDNCDGDWENGCEVPVGIPGVCDAQGLNMDSGCWTAWCGESNAPDTFNFGTYYCADCSTCREDGGQCQWCNHDSGQWYPAEACACDPAYHDVACGA